MRDEITISLIGPFPRSHSPALLVKSLIFIMMLRLTDLVTQLGGTFVIFPFDRLCQFLAKPGEIDLPFHRHAASAARAGTLPR